MDFKYFTIYCTEKIPNGEDAAGRTDKLHILLPPCFEQSKHA